VFSTRQHFTADELLAWSQVRDRSVSRATVYRTLPLLTASGLVRELDFGRDRQVYDPNYADHPNHNHLICEDCDRIIEFESDKIARLADEIGRGMGFAVTGQKLQLTGACRHRDRHRSSRAP
jgi:Fur family ferric uptake transcriptional regulator